MKTSELMEKLKRLPVFTLNDLAKLTGHKPATVRILASRLSKRNLIKRIEKGKYTILDEPLVITAYMTRPSYIGLYSALRFHNMTTQAVSNIDVMIPKSRKEANVLGKRVMFTKTRQFWGFEKYKFGGYDVPVSDPEKTIVDCILSEKVRPDSVLEALKSIDVDEAKLLSYVRKCDNSALGKRVGFLLEKIGADTHDYRNYSTGRYVKLDPKGLVKGRKNKNWKIIENLVV